MIPSAAATVLFALVIAAACWRGRRSRARHVALDRIEQAATAGALARARRAERHAGDLAVHAGRVHAQLSETTERLVTCEQDRDALQLIGAGLLRRAWRAERAVAAVRARDERMAYVEQDVRAGRRCMDPWGDECGSDVCPVHGDRTPVLW